MFRTKLLKLGFTGLVAAFCGGLIVETGNAHVAKNALLADSTVPPHIRSILQRACQDCHSENTVWPWYAHVPPVSWEVQSDVEHGRAFMNFSKWNEYSDAERRGIMAAIAAATKGGVMPPAKYTWIHRSAKLSDGDLKELGKWAIAGAKARSENSERDSR